MSDSERLLRWSKRAFLNDKGLAAIEASVSVTKGKKYGSVPPFEVVEGEHEIYASAKLLLSDCDGQVEIHQWQFHTQKGRDETLKKVHLIAEIVNEFRDQVEIALSLTPISEDDDER